MADYIIIGGHGKIALRTAPLLVRAGHTVTSVIRNPEHTADVEATGATALVLDVEQASRDDLATAFTGKDAVIFSAGAGGGNPDRTYAVDRDAAIRSIDATRQAGVRRYVMVSYYGADPNHGVPEDDPFYPYAESKSAADEYLRGSGLDWTVLGPSRLTLEEPSGKIRLRGSGDEGGVEHEVSRANVARTIVAALEIDNTIGKTLDYIDGDTDIRDAFQQA